MSKKVYCSECELFLEQFLDDSNYYDCLAPQNIKEDWYGNNHSGFYLPYKKNANNDCDWFKAKEIPF